ncbi:hypothetical protein BH24ACT26_BH24ACT26_04860 [soil metagenome]
MTVHALKDQTELWLPLLRQLTEASLDWAVWKNADAGLSGAGDVDFIAPVGDWGTVEHHFLRWARAGELGPVIVCRHAPGALFLIAVNEGGQPWLQLDVRARVTLRGATVFRAREVATSMIVDARGFRRLRPGAEGALKLVISGLAPGGRPNHSGLRKEHVAELLREDPGGVEATARLLGRARPALLSGARAAARGGWDRGAMLRVEAYVMSRGSLEPWVAAGQVAMRRAKKRCPVLATGIAHGRRIPGERAAWLRRVHETHIVHGLEPCDD